MSEAGFLRLLDIAIEQQGGVRAFARRHKLSAAYVSDVRLLRRPIGPRIAKALGYRLTVTRIVKRELTSLADAKPEPATYAFNGAQRLNPFAR